MSRVLHGRVKGLRMSALHRDWRRKRAKLQRGLCAICGKPMGTDVTLDHKISLAADGADHWENTQATHLLCNQDKGDGLR